MRPPSSAVVNITWSKRIRFAHLLPFYPNDCSMWDWFIYSDNGILTPDRCKPFDSAADGYITNSTVRLTRILTLIIFSFVRGEGAVAIVIKPLEAALADNDHIYAVVRSNSFFAYPTLSLSHSWQVLGTAINNNGSDATPSKPSGKLQQQCIRDAFLNAGRDPREVDYVELHATGTLFPMDLIRLPLLTQNSHL